MWHRRALEILICAGGLSMVSGAAVAQVPPWNEGPGDIVITRHVPRQNAVLVGEPGRPTLVNPKSSLAGTGGDSVTAGMFSRPLTDLEAEAVRATRGRDLDVPNRADQALAADEAGNGAFAAGQSLGHERTGFMGNAVSGAMSGAGRQVQDALSSALGRGRL